MQAHLRKNEYFHPFCWLALPGIVKGITNKYSNGLSTNWQRTDAKKYAIILDKICRSCLFSRIEINNTRFVEQNNRFEDQIFGFDNKQNPTVRMRNSLFLSQKILLPPAVSLTGCQLVQVTQSGWGGWSKDYDEEDFATVTRLECQKDPKDEVMRWDASS